MLDDLYNRLDRKAYESAKLYYTIEDYKAATHALKETLKDNPESSYREDILYYIVAANYHYANNSIPALQRERFLNLIDEYYNFISEYPDSRYRREMDTMFKRAQQFTTRNNN
jgi:outer membrane protein assembly factor BamD